MSYRKRTRSHVYAAEVRLSGIKAFSETLDFGNGISVPGYTAAINSQHERIAKYNSLLSQADELKSLIYEGERQLLDYSERMLAGVATHYGKDSNEYEMAGGMKKSRRKRKPYRPRTTLRVVAKASAVTAV